MQKRKKATIKQKVYIMDYQKENVKQIKFTLSKIHDLDIIEYLDGIQNKNGYLKDLIRQDMKKGSE